MWIRHGHPINTDYSPVPFSARPTYEACHRHLALTERDELVEIFNQAGMSPTGRWLLIRRIKTDGSIEIGGDVWETQGDDLAPVDVSAPDWKSKAQRWRVEQRAQRIDHELPTPTPTGAKPRF